MASAIKKPPAHIRRDVIAATLHRGCRSNYGRNCEKLHLPERMKRFRWPTFIITCTLKRFFEHIQMSFFNCRWSEIDDWWELFKVGSTNPPQPPKTTTTTTLLARACVYAEDSCRLRAAALPIKNYLMAFAASALPPRLICRADKVSEWVSYRRRACWMTRTHSPSNHWSVLSQPPHSNSCRRCRRQKSDMFA